MPPVASKSSRGLGARGSAEATHVQRKTHENDNKNDTTMTSTILAAPAPRSPQQQELVQQRDALHPADVPSGPHTPQRYKQQQYSSLGRVPLHRRGTSTQYERLEDLLREAGYKETRVFTPESERRRGSPASGANSPNPEDKNDAKTFTGVGGLAGVVAGFLAAFVPGGASDGGGGVRRASSVRERGSKATPPPEIRLPVEEYTPPPSPCPSPSPSPSKKLERPQPHPGLLRSPSSASASPTKRNLSTQRSNTAPTPPSSSSSPRILTSAVPDPNVHPRLHLRHMASAPSMPPPNARGVPPLPNTWRTTAQEAVSRSHGSHIGGPSKPRRSMDSAAGMPDMRRRQSTRGSIREKENFKVPDMPPRGIPTSQRSVVETPALRHARSLLAKHDSQPRSSSSYFGESEDRGRSRGRSRGGATPQLLLATHAKSRRSESEVSRTRVVCRSRASSPNSHHPRAIKTKSKPKTVGNASVPPEMTELGTEGDGSMLFGLRDGEAKSPSSASSQLRHHRQSSGSTRSPSPTHSDDEHSDEDDQPLDLSQLLIPPKRQNSIASLRRHLPPPPPLPTLPLPPTHHGEDEEEEGDYLGLGSGMTSGTVSSRGSTRGSLRGLYSAATSWTSLGRPHARRQMSYDRFVTSAGEEDDEQERALSGAVLFGGWGSSSKSHSRSMTRDGRRLPAQWTSQAPARR